MIREETLVPIHKIKEISKIALTHESYYKVMGQIDRDTYEKMYFYIREPIRIFTWKIYNESYLSYETNDEIPYG